MTLGNLHVNQHKNIIVSDKNPTVQKCIITVILVIISLIHSQVYLWADKYRPRKPRFFNRVHTVCFSLFWLCQQVLIAYYTIFSDKLWTLFEQKHPLPSLSLKIAYPIVSVSYSQPVSKLLCWGGGGKVRQVTVSLTKDRLHHPHQSTFWIIFKFLRHACKPLSPLLYLAPESWLAG